MEKTACFEHFFYVPVGLPGKTRKRQLGTWVPSTGGRHGVSHWGTINIEVVTEARAC